MHMRTEIKKGIFLEFTGKEWRLTDDWLSDYLVVYDSSGKFGCDGRFYLTANMVEKIKSILASKHYAMFTNSIDKRYMPAKITDLPIYGQTLSGTGKAIPTQYMVFYKKRWHRVYCSIFSNNGTLYIDKKLFLTLTIFEA